MATNGSAVDVFEFPWGRHRDLRTRFRHVAALLIASALGACNTADRLSQVGVTPALSRSRIPPPAGLQAGADADARRQPVSYAPNSLWRTGSRAFFKDQRAARLGDLLTVKVNVTDKANLANETKRSRANSESFGLPNALGLENDAVGKAFGVGGSALLSAKSATAERRHRLGPAGRDGDDERRRGGHAGAANGNLVVEGHQEIRVNFEVRELIVAGVVRPEDIQSDNTIDSTKIAQARIAYGGRGQITDVQQPRYGQQIVDILLPF